MKLHDHNRPRRGHVPTHATAEELAARHDLALTWRAAWQAEQAAATYEPAKEVAPAPPARRGVDEAGRRGQFAQALARAEFGRFYFKAPSRHSSAKAPRQPPLNGHKRS